MPDTPHAASGFSGICHPRPSPQGNTRAASADAIPSREIKRTLAASAPRDSEPKTGRHPEHAKDLQSFAFHRRASSMERRPAPGMLTPQSTQTVGDPSQAQEVGLGGALATEGRVVVNTRQSYLSHELVSLTDWPKVQVAVPPALKRRVVNEQRGMATVMAGLRPACACGRGGARWWIAVRW